MFLKHLHEGERGYGASYYSATAKLYHGVDNAVGALDGPGPMLENDSRLIERHIQRLAVGRPADVIVQDLLETGAKKTKTKRLSPYEKMLNRLSSTSRLNIYRGNR